VVETIFRKKNVELNWERPGCPPREGLATGQVCMGKIKKTMGRRPDIPKTNLSGGKGSRSRLEADIMVYEKKKTRRGVKGGRREETTIKRRERGISTILEVGEKGGGGGCLYTAPTLGRREKRVVKDNAVQELRAILKREKRTSQGVLRTVGKSKQPPTPTRPEGTNAQPRIWTPKVNRERVHTLGGKNGQTDDGNRLSRQQK